MKTIAERVKAVRQELGWSQVRLAAEVGVSQSSIGNIESGFRQRPRELVSIAKALQVSPEWLETGKVRGRNRVHSSSSKQTLSLQ